MAGCCLLTAGTAWAGDVHQYPPCSKVPTQSEVDGAQGAFQAGDVSFKEADYERAILYWEDAYRRDCTVPLLLHYLSRAYEGKGDLPQTVVALKTYLERDPNAPERPQIEKRIQVFEQRIEAERIRAEEAQRKANSPAPVVATAPVQSKDAGGLYVQPLIPLVVAGVGVGAGLIGSVVYFSARSDLKDAQSKCDNQAERKDCPASVVKAGESARSRVTWGGTVAITGLVLAAGGTGWYFFNDSQDPKKRAPKTAVLQPIVGPDTVGLLWQGTF